MVSDQFLRLLDPDPDLAAAKYRDLFARLVKFFEWRNCRPADDLAQETLRRGLTRVAAGVDVYTADPNHYFFGIARFVALENWKAPRLDSSGELDEQVSGLHTPAQIEAGILLDQCLAALDPVERALLLRYHTGDRDELRAEVGLDATALRVRVHRIVKKVRREMLESLVAAK